MVFRRLINCLAFGLIVIIGLSVSGCHDEENFETETTEKKCCLCICLGRGMNFL